MAEGKKSFVLYADYKHTFDLLTDEQAGKLIKHLLRYVNDENPEMDDILLKVAFEPIKRQLKRDLVDWEESRSRRSEAGHLGGIKSAESRKKKQKQANEAMLEKSKQTKQGQANQAVNVNGNVTVNVKERENTAPAHDIKDSNLFRKPKIPTKQQTLEAIVNAGGNKEMAKSFYEKHQSTGWYINGSPIVDYVSLANRFVTNWKDNDDKNGKKYEPEKTAPTPKYLNQNDGI